MQMECDDLQTTGDMERFVSTNSARTAIGHDKDGNVLLLHVEGKTYSPRGYEIMFNLLSFVTHGYLLTAEFLKNRDLELPNLNFPGELKDFR